MKSNLFMHGLEQRISSARQLSDMVEILHQEAEEKAIKRRGAEAQMESVKIIAKQIDELEVMRATINALLDSNLQQAELQARAAQSKDQIEVERYYENLRFTKIAVWTGVFGIIIGVISIIIQNTL